MKHPRKTQGLGLVLFGLLLGMFLFTPATAHYTTSTKHLGQHAWNQVIKAKVFTKKQANDRFALKKAEAYRLVGTTGQPPFQNGWGNFGFGWSATGFYKDSENLVHLKGTFEGPSGFTAFTLPVGYRPPENLLLPIAGIGNDGLRIFVDGTVVPVCATSSCIAGIDGLTFRVGPGAGAAAAASDSTGTG
ncbi:MAG TPA: hypothetical protein VF058_02620, partial [Actinomycetota bacterium]